MRLDIPSYHDPSDDLDALYPQAQVVEDLSELLALESGKAPRAVIGDNVDDDGVAHFLLITPDADVPDLCGGCRKTWPCDHRVGVEVTTLPEVDPAEEKLREIALQAAREALQQQRPS